MQQITPDNFTALCNSALRENTQTYAVNTSGDPPWWNLKCRKLLGQKRKFLRLARTFLSREYWLKHKKFSCLLRKEIKKSVRHYWDEVCNSGGDKKKIYNIIKRIGGKSDSRNNIIMTNSSCITNVQKQTDLFLRYFQNPNTHEPLPYDLSGNNEYINSVIVIDEVKRAINNTRNSSPGEDGITAKLLKQIQEKHTQKLVDMYNCIFDSGNIPQDWKTALIVPILKPTKDSKSITSYRPISLTSVVGKIFEKIILQRLTKWVYRENIIQKMQCGFLPSKDSQAVLTTLYNAILNARKINHSVAMINLDIKSAYDSVWIDGLIYKLLKVGINGKTGKIIANWLSNRWIKVRWKGNVSRQAPTNQGVPQGSVLAQLLFMIYLSDIFEAVEQGVKMIIYADDIIIYASSADRESIGRKLQRTIDNIAQ